jgi:hypothetical protein
MQNVLKSIVFLKLVLKKLHISELKSSTLDERQCETELKA